VSHPLPVGYPDEKTDVMDTWRLGFLHMPYHRMFHTCSD
jgi:hypothetical protein